MELVQEGYQFTEGPVGTPDGGLYFTDNRANKILLLDRKGKITVVHENTNNANGLALTQIRRSARSAGRRQDASTAEAATAR